MSPGRQRFRRLIERGSNVNRSIALFATAAMTLSIAANGAAVAAEALSILKVGDKAPVLLGLRSDGDASTVRPWPWLGRYTLVIFWSPSNPASIRELHVLRRLYQEFGDRKDFRIVAVATELPGTEDAASTWNRWVDILREQPDVVNFTGKQQLFASAWVQLFEAERFDAQNFPLDDRGQTSSGRFGVTQIPVSFLIGPDGKLAAVHIPSDRLHHTLSDVFLQRD